MKTTRIVNQFHGTELEEMEKGLDEWIEAQNKGWERAIELGLVDPCRRPAFYDEGNHEK